MQAFAGWTEYEQMSAANWRPNFGHHSAPHDYTVKITDPNHPITKGLKLEFPQTSDELYLVSAVPSMHAAPVFQMFAPGAPRLSPGLLLAYVVFIPFQELIYRGGLQGALEHFLSGPRAKWQAIFASNIIFSAAHLYISPGFSLVAFFTGLFWGWLYARQKGLIGVSVSHILLGIWALDVVDLGVLE